MSSFFSIRYGVQRITREVAIVSVPISREVLTATNSIDSKKAGELALKISAAASPVWEPDGKPEVSLHPLQLPPK